MTSKKLYQPEGWQFGLHQSRSGAIIRYGVTLPEKQPAYGTVIMTGGYGRYIEHYYEAINNWRDRGYQVFAMDWDGQGGSSRDDPHAPLKPSSKDFSHQVDIFDEFVKDVVQPAADKPAFLCSHSMGGNIILRYLAQHENEPDFPFDGAILAAPMIDINTYFVARHRLRVLVNTAHMLGIDDIIPAKGTRLFQEFRKNALFNKAALDKDRQQAQDHYRYNTMHNRTGYPTASWLRNAFNSSDIVNRRSFLTAIKTPVLIITPEQDNLVCRTAQIRTARYLQNGRQVHIANARHGIWYDRTNIQKQLWREIDNFTAPLLRPAAQASKSIKPQKPPKPPQPGN